LLTWKRAEDGAGTILRLQDTAGEVSNIRIHSPFFTFERAWLCNLLEDNQAEIKIQGEDLSVLIKTVSGAHSQTSHHAAHPAR